MVLIKKSRYLPHFLKFRKINSNASFLVFFKEDTVIQDIIKTDVAVSLQYPTKESHPRGPSQDPTLKSHLRVPPQGPGSHFFNMPSLELLLFIRIVLSIVTNSIYLIFMIFEYLIFEIIFRLGRVNLLTFFFYQHFFFCNK